MEHDSDYFHKGFSQWIAPRVFIWWVFFSFLNYIHALHTKPKELVSPPRSSQGH